jgi:5-enolpyruvylshikimate-3-phosphate synthase
MAVTLDQLQAQRDAIIGEMGQPNVQFAERALTRRPQAELEAALRKIDAEIARLQSSQSTVFTIQTSRGIK